MMAVSPSYEALQQQFVKISADLVEAVETAAAERAARRQCQSIVDSMPGLTYRCRNDPDYTTVFIGGSLPALRSDQALALLSRARNAFARVIHPDDLPMVRNAIDSQLATDSGYDVEYRIFLEDGAVCWVNDRGRMRRDEVGQVQYLDGMILDITARKRAEQALRESEARFRILVDHSHDLISLVDADGCLAYVSPSWESHLGYPRSFWIGKSWRPLIHPDDVPLCEHYLEEVEAARKGFPGPQYRVRHADGHWRWYETAVEPVYDDEHGLSSFVAISRDIHDRKRREDQVLEMAYHDPLTGLANRPLFMDHLGLALARARRKFGRVAVALLDLDRFKRVNDEFGHDVGDQLLRAVARRLESLVRESDTVARFGGDEFLLVLSDLTAVEDVIPLAAKIVDSFAQPFQVGGHGIEVTTSVGMALYPDDAEDPDALVKKADKAMYHAKRTGRNRYTFSGQMEN